MTWNINIPMESVARWGQLPPIQGPPYMTGSRPDGTLILIRSTGEIVEKTPRGYKVI